MSARIFRCSFTIFAVLVLRSALATESCLRLYDDITEMKSPVISTLRKTSESKTLIEHLREGLDANSKQPFAIRGRGADQTGFFLVPSASDYERVKFNIGRKPNLPLPRGAKIVEHPSFGYNLPQTFRKIGPLEYIVLDTKGTLIEIGAPTAAALAEFQRHFHGVDRSTEELARIAKINTKILDVLRNLPAAQKKLEAFAVSRKWPPGMAEEGKLAYFDPSVFDLQAWMKNDSWAKANDVTMADLVDAGWYRLSFDYSGNPKYFLNAPDSIKIPYFSASGNGEAPIWRSRNLSKNNPNLPKYQGWQLDRSVTRPLGVSERLYNGWKLPQVKGKPIIITEGEFKCLVTEKITGIPMFGIPGITEFDDEMVKALVEADASEYFVVLDRDPHGKALFRADEVTDSNRAAYSLAKDLEAAGAKKVYVGTLPEIVSGEKLGIDDLALRYGAEPVRKLLEDARGVDANTYANSIGLDTGFQELNRRRSKLRKAIENRKIHNQRQGMKQEDPLITRSNVLLKDLNRTFSNYLEHELNGARSLNSASGKVNSIRPGKIPSTATKKVVLDKSKWIGAETFEDDVLLLDYVPSDVALQECRPAGCGQTPFSTKELQEAFSGASPSGDLAADLEEAKDLAAEVGFQPKTIEEFSLLAIAGQLTHHFPVDEFSYHFGVRLVSGGTDVNAILPLTVFKRNSGRAMAIVDLHLPNGRKYWHRRMGDLNKTLDYLRGRHE